MIKNNELMREIIANCRGPEVEIQIAMWTVSLKASFAFKAEPAIPNRLRELVADMDTPAWKKMSREDKKDTKQRVYSDRLIMDCMEDLYKVRQANLSNAIWLEKCMSWLLEWEESNKAHELWKIYEDYPASIAWANDSIWAKSHSSAFGKEIKTEKPEPKPTIKPDPEMQRIFQIMTEVGMMEEDEKPRIIRPESKSSI